MIIVVTLEMTKVTTEFVIIDDSCQQQIAIKMMILFPSQYENTGVLMANAVCEELQCGGALIGTEWNPSHLKRRAQEQRGFWRFFYFCE
jgi:hypothetical protein